MTSYWYYSHRYSSPSWFRRNWNLLRALWRCRKLRAKLAYTCSVCAPWIGWALADWHEDDVWMEIEFVIERCDGIILDLDGGEMSPGTLREKEYAEKLGKKVEVIP